MAVAANADDYAAPRQNHFFTANNETPADGNLTGQCVTLLKWFFQDMCNGFPSPFAARGNAKDVGHTLVAQGLAYEVPFAERQPGDVICYEYGTYGHIASQLSGGRVFEENVNWSGVASRVVDGETVYASRIGSENEAWRQTRNPHIYRLKSYGGNMAAKDTPVDATTVQLEYNNGLLRNATAEEVAARVNAGNTVENLQRSVQASAEHLEVIRCQQVGSKVSQLLGMPDLQAHQVEDAMKAKYGTGGNCTADERAYLDAMYKVVTKKG